MVLAAVSIGAVLFFIVLTAKKQRERKMAGMDVEDAEDPDATGRDGFRASGFQREWK